MLITSRITPLQPARLLFLLPRQSSLPSLTRPLDHERRTAPPVSVAPHSKSSPRNLPSSCSSSQGATFVQSPSRLGSFIDVVSHNLRQRLYSSPQSNSPATLRTSLNKSFDIHAPPSTDTSNTSRSLRSATEQQPKAQPLFKAKLPGDLTKFLSPKKEATQQRAIVKSVTNPNRSCCFNSTNLPSASHLRFHALFRPFSNHVTMAVPPHFLFIFLIGTMFAEVQFSTHLNDKPDTPIFNKGAAFVFKYQAVTSESESKVRVFSLIPRLPEINLTEAYSSVAHRGHSDTLAAMNTVKQCQTVASEDAYELHFNRIDEQLTILDKELAEAKADRNRLVEIATLFLPQTSIDACSK